MKRIATLFFIASILSFQLKAQKDLPVFAQHGECFLNVGNPNEVILYNNIAYCGTEAGLLLLDISNPDNPEFLSCYYTDKQVSDIYVSDGIALVGHFAYWDPLLSVVDVSNPVSPSLLCQIAPDNLTIESVCRKGDYIFITANDKLEIFDISNLIEPSLINTLIDIEPIDMEISGNNLFAISKEPGTYTKKLCVIDIENINSPEVLCWVGENTSGWSDLEISDDFVYISGYNLNVFDASNLNEPQLISQLEVTSSWTVDTYVDENYCYTLTSDSIVIVNIEDPENPYSIEEYAFKGTNLGYSNGTLMVVKSFDYDIIPGIDIFNIDANQQIEPIANYYTDKAKDVYIHGNYAFVANGFNGMKIINIENPANPFSVSDCLQGNGATELLVDNGIAYVRTYYGFKIIDVSDVYNPNELGGVMWPNYVEEDVLYAIEKYGDYLYIGGDWFSNILVYDVSDPNNPENVGQFPVNDWCPDLAIFDDHLYATGYWGGLMIFDLTNPVFPPIAGYYPMAMSSRIAVGEDMAIVTGAVDPNSYGGVEIFDLTDLNNPIHAGTYEFGVNDIQCLDQYLFSAHRDYQDINSSIKIVNVSNINSPFIEQEIMGVKPNGLFCKGDKLVAIEDFKFKIFGDSLTVSDPKPLINLEHFSLRCYPNPAKGNTNISFQNEIQCQVKLAVYNIKGELVNVLIDKDFFVGEYSYSWDLKNRLEKKLNHGLYFITLQLDDKFISQKLIISNE